jgi:hypothetical protein
VNSREGIPADEQAADPEDADDVRARFHVMVHSLLYPAFLGSFIFGLVIGSSGALEGVRLAFIILFLIYFSLQHAEAVTDPKRQNWGRSLFSVLEIVAMFMLMRSLGVFDSQLDRTTEIGWASRGLMIATLAVPMASLIAARREAPEHWPFYGSLFALSFSAILVVLLLSDVAAAWAFGLILAVYVGLFHLNGIKWFKLDPKWTRPKPLQ